MRAFCEVTRVFNRLSLGLGIPVLHRQRDEADTQFFRLKTAAGAFDWLGWRRRRNDDTLHITRIGERHGDRFVLRIKGHELLFVPDLD